MLPAAAALRWSGLFTYFPVLSLFDTRLLLASNQTLLVLCLRVKIMGSLWAYSGETGQRDPQQTHRSCREPPPAPGEFAYFSITQSHLDTRDKNTPTAFGPCAKNNCHQYWLALGDPAEFKNCRLWNPSWGSFPEIGAYLWHVPMFKLICENCEINKLPLRTIWLPALPQHAAIFVLIVSGWLRSPPWKLWTWSLNVFGIWHLTFPWFSEMVQKRWG